MSIRLMADVWEVQLDNPVAKLILLKLADNASDEGICFPSIATIARHCCCDRSTVKRHIKQLAADGYIEVERRHRKNGSKTSNAYTVRCSSDEVPVSANASEVPGSDCTEARGSLNLGTVQSEPTHIGGCNLNPPEPFNHKLNQDAHVRVLRSEYFKKGTGFARMKEIERELVDLVGDAGCSAVLKVDVPKVPVKSRAPRYGKAAR